MRLRPVGGLDTATGALVLGGAGLIALSLVGLLVLLVPAGTQQGTLTGVEVSARPPADRVSAVLNVDAAIGAASAAQAGDRVDVLGYFSKQVTGTAGMTRVVVHDVPVLTSERSGSNVALTLALPQDAAMLLQEAQALGAKPFVTLRALDAPLSAEPAQASYSDADLAARVAGVH
jgi:hypothetical protein